MRIGDWGLGLRNGDWGLRIGDWGCCSWGASFDRHCWVASLLCSCDVQLLLRHSLRWSAARFNNVGFRSGMPRISCIPPNSLHHHWGPSVQRSQLLELLDFKCTGNQQSSAMSPFRCQCTAPSRSLALWLWHSISFPAFWLLLSEAFSGHSK